MTDDDLERIQEALWRLLAIAEAHDDEDRTLETMWAREAIIAVNPTVRKEN